MGVLGQLYISCPTACYDSLFYGRYPHGDKPTGAVLAGGATDTTFGDGELAGGSAALAAAAMNTTAATGVVTSSGGFFADPYSAYASVIADSTFGGTAGASTTVSWNGSTITAPTYSTLQAAINAGVAAGPGTTGRRVCVLTSQNWTANVAAGGFVFPSTSAFSSTLRLVVQGDPAATATTLPVITGGGTSSGSNGAQGFTVGYNYYTGVGTNNQYITIRKLEITNFVNTNGAQGVISGTQSGGVMKGLTVEYCYLHHFQASGSAGESGGVYFDVPGDTSALTVQYCKISDILTVGGSGINENHSCVGLYGATVQIHHNDFSQTFNGVRFKVCNSNIPTGDSVYKNNIHDVNVGIAMANGGEGPGPNGVQVYGNLFGWHSINNGLFQSGAAAVNDFQADSGTTSPANNAYYNNTITTGWSGGGLLNVVSATCSSYNNITLCSTPLWTNETGKAGSFSTCDYNAYFSPNWIMNAEGSPAITITTFAGWQAAHTNNPTAGGLSANPDVHGLYIPAQTLNTIAGNFPGYATYDYTLASGSAMKGAGSGGMDMGYNPADCGPGW